MSKTKELLTITELVYAILATDKQARNSDYYLYLKVLEIQARQKEIDIKKLPVTTFLLKASELGFAHFETVRRTRQKLQAEHPFLNTNFEVQQFRSENEKAFREFARGGA